MRTIGLENMTFYAYHGMYQSEQELGCHFDISLKVTVPINEFVDYTLLFNLTKNVMQSNYQKLEEIAQEITLAINHALPIVHSIYIKVAKKNPPIGGLCSMAYVEQTTTITV